MLQTQLLKLHPRRNVQFNLSFLYRTFTTSQDTLHNMDSEKDYRTWSHDQLVARVKDLDCRIRHLETNLTKQPEKINYKHRPIDRSKYSTRLIALKFAYLGQAYNGFEHHANSETALPGVEKALWNALAKARLVFADTSSPSPANEPNWEGHEYSKCGRTDRGVSAFGQVIALRVRSNLPPKQESEQGRDSSVQSNTDSTANPPDDLDLTSSPQTAFDTVQDEIPYCKILNRLLPPDIRVLAWCPHPPPNFSARFSCRERRYEYFFTQPAFNPRNASPNLIDSSDSHEFSGWLDIDTMRMAAKKYEGLHDFRNFCKIDSSKQIENFERRIFHSDIEILQPHETSGSFIHPHGNLSQVKQSSGPVTCVFRLHGSAFLWHQVRHMVSILFLIGQGLESPALIDELLDVQRNPRRPIYEMADETPLVLKDCIFPDLDTDTSNDTHGRTKFSRPDALQWIYGDENVGVEKNNTNKRTTGGDYDLVNGVWKQWREKKMDEIMAGQLLNLVASGRPGQVSNSGPEADQHSQRVFAGGDSARLAGKYVPVLNRPKMESVETLNEKFRERARMKRSVSNEQE